MPWKLEDDKNYWHIITLDVRNTLNSADWDSSLVALHEWNMARYLIELVRDYFKYRVILYDCDAGVLHNSGQ